MYSLIVLQLSPYCPLTVFYLYFGCYRSSLLFLHLYVERVQGICFVFPHWQTQLPHRISAGSLNWRENSDAGSQREGASVAGLPVVIMTGLPSGLKQKRAIRPLPAPVAAPAVACFLSDRAEETATCGGTEKLFLFSRLFVVVYCHRHTLGSEVKWLYVLTWLGLLRAE